MALCACVSLRVCVCALFSLLSFGHKDLSFCGKAFQLVTGDVRKKIKATLKHSSLCAVEM